jgi:hypothetical protein
MGLITIPSDSDGTLHGASLHNDKFSTVVNAINGNLTHDNLAYPESIVILRPHSFVIPYAGPTAAGTGTNGITNVKWGVAGWHEADFVAGSGVESAYTDAASGENYLTNSLIKTEAAYNCVAVTSWWQSHPFHGTSLAPTLKLEYASTNDDDKDNWTLISSDALTVPGSATSVLQEDTWSVSGKSIPSGKYVRVRMTSGGSYAEPAHGPDLPEVHVHIVLSTRHVA